MFSISAESDINEIIRDNDYYPPEEGTLLYFACKYGDFEAVDNLLIKGSDPHIHSVYGMSPIQIAAENGYIKIVDRLIKAGVNINNDTFGTPLYRACAKGHINMINYLILNHAHINNTKHNYGNPLITACFNRQIEVVTLLLAAGADPNTKSLDNKTPLFYACYKGDIEIMKKLLTYGADIHVKNLNWSPLSLACHNGHFNIVKTLVTLGVDINQRNQHGKTALMYSVKNSYRDIVNFLLDEGADSEIVDYRGKTAFDYANNNKEMILILNYHKCKKGSIKNTLRANLNYVLRGKV